MEEQQRRRRGRPVGTKNKPKVEFAPVDEQKVDSKNESYMIDPKFIQYTCRLELDNDQDRVKQALDAHGVEYFDVNRIYGMLFGSPAPGGSWTFKSSSTLDELLSIMDSVHAHVQVQTLERSEDYTGDRRLRKIKKLPKFKPELASKAISESDSDQNDSKDETHYKPALKVCQQVPPKRRGRPAGTKNKPKVESVAPVEPVCGKYIPVLCVRPFEVKVPSGLSARQMINIVWTLDIGDHDCFYYDDGSWSFITENIVYVNRYLRQKFPDIKFTVTACSKQTAKEVELSHR